MSFCRITGKARGLPKPNYFPLLPPISPADAKRFCRITTKSQGLPGHHFVPALLGARGSRTHCRVTGKSEGQAPHRFPNVESNLKAHDFIPGYKYVFPRFDEDKKLQQKIIQLISSKTVPGESNARFVYAVEESLTGLVIPAGLEAAVRDGDIRDLMLDKEKDTMLVKLHKGPSVTIDVTDLVMEEGMTLWDGLGPSQAVLKQWEKEEKEMEERKRKRQEGLHQRKQIFEDKEKAADEEEMEMTRIKKSRKSKIVKVKMRGGADDVDVVVGNGLASSESYLCDVNDKPVFGHIVQTATAIEFFPGETILNLPEGKVVPGRLVRNSEGVKFVPGIMSDGRFIPGQVVMTNSGEQFVPGQVVDTRDGPKFVPGQVAETVSGPKFVPGQTIETEDGPQFVPGQIIETKAGPTFIPGQIIVTDDKPRFVPGRVVETAEGPRFVPGRVIESGNQVTFVSGQVVETSEGLKFVAPDLEYMPEGGHEFSVQGFEVSPEELKLLRPVASCDPASCGPFSIDSKMLRQLSEAGMSVGRQVPTKLPEVVIRELPVVVEKLKLNGAQALKLSHVMTVLSQVALKISQRSDLCASEVELEENTSDKILCAVKNKKDLGKYLKAIVASSVVAARNDVSEESILCAVGGALENALSTMYELNLTKESVLAVIGSVFDDRVKDQLMREQLLVDVNSAIERELSAKLDSGLTKESFFDIVNAKLDSVFSREGSADARAELMKAVQTAVEKEQFSLYRENINDEGFLEILSSAIDPKILEKANQRLKKESLLSIIRSDIETQRSAGMGMAFTEENMLNIIKSAVEREAVAEGVTLTNGSLPAAIMTCLKKELSAVRGCALSEEKLLSCLASVIENGLPSEMIGENLAKVDFLRVVKEAVADEKRSALERITSEEGLLAATYAALEKVSSKALETVPDREDILKVVVQKIQREVAVKRENAEKKASILKNLEKAIERKISDTCDSVLNEEMAVAAVSAAIDGEIGKFGSAAKVPKEKISLAISKAFEKERSITSTPLMNKDKLMAVLSDVLESENCFAAVNPTEKLLAALDAVVEEKRKAKYETFLTDQVLMSSINSAVDQVLSEVKEMKIDKAILLKVAENEVKKLRSTAKEKVTDGRVIAAVQSAITKELTAMGEAPPVVESFLRALDSEMVSLAVSRPTLLTEEELLKTLESVVESELLRNPECSIGKDILMASVASAIESKKCERRDNILTEEIMMLCVQKAIEAEISNKGGERSVALRSLLSNVTEEMEEVRAKKRMLAVLAADIPQRAVDSVLRSELLRDNAVSLTEAELMEVVDEVVKRSESEEIFRGELAVAEEKLIDMVRSVVAGKVADEKEADLLATALGSAVASQVSQVMRNHRITEKEFMAIAGEAMERELTARGETSITKDDLLSAVASAVEDQVMSRGGPIAEEVLLAAAYSAIERDVIGNGGGTHFAELLLSRIDSAVEIERDGRRTVNEGIILEAINEIADEFMFSSDSKREMLRAVTSAVEMEKSSQGISALTGKILLDAVTGAVEDHLAVNSEAVTAKQSFIAALSSAISKEQSTKRGKLLTKDLLGIAVASALEDQISQNPGLAEIKENLLRAAESAVEGEFSSPTERHLAEKALLSALGSSMEIALGELSGTDSLEQVVDSMQKYLSENLDEVIVGTVNYMAANESAVDKLRYAVNNSSDAMHVIEKLSSVLNDSMGEAFQKLSLRDPSLLKNVIESLDVEKLSSAEEATEALQKAIVGAVRQKSAETLRDMMDNSSVDGKDFKELLLQAVGLAKALGMKQVASVLLDVASDSTSHEVFANDETIIDVLQRLTIMRQFAETKPELASALRQLISDPELAKRDPGIRELVRHSTALMTVPEEMLQSSADIPASLLVSDNTLEMEQFLARSRRPRTLLILKAGIQAVVPKESARAVLTGQVPYAVLDEKGIKYFEPMHVFSTLKLQCYAANCFSMYRCPEVDCESDSPVLSTPRGSFSSAEDCMSRERDRRYSAANGPGESHRRRYFPPRRRFSDLGKRPGYDPLVVQKDLFNGGGFEFRDGYGLHDRRLRERNGMYFTQGCL